MRKITEKDIQENKEAFNSDEYLTRYLLGIFTPGLMVLILNLRNRPLVNGNNPGVLERNVKFSEIQEVF